MGKTMIESIDQANCPACRRSHAVGDDCPSNNDDGNVRPFHKGIKICGPFYSVWRARGALRQRQEEARTAGCVCYVEQHMNSINNTSTNYACAIVDSGSPSKARLWARDYVSRVAEEFQIRNSGVVVGGSRGTYNVRFSGCPAMLVEPGFISNAEFAARVRTGEGIDALARCLVESICEQFPDGGLVGLSVGHAYRDAPDPGAPLNEGELHDPEFDTEVEMNEAIIIAAEEMLLAASAGAPK